MCIITIIIVCIFSATRLYRPSFYHKYLHMSVVFPITCRRAGGGQPILFATVYAAASKAVPPMLPIGQGSRRHRHTPAASRRRRSGLNPSFFLRSSFAPASPAAGTMGQPATRKGGGSGGGRRERHAGRGKKKAATWCRGCGVTMVSTVRLCRGCRRGRCRHWQPLAGRQWCRSCVRTSGYCR